ncbi:MAG: hypothetical protein KF871_10920 [Hydrogenophaga sp.]|uniref:hypothetical protein n=1 Tax=Hydrogenophaga sp. TaxID=1904254 RepID=UPI001DA304FA|nr:hypothetical protein [Hydrogenophaga sp.]MBX3610394.1 hypothetical protein [Hydrogenophaga sp.]
MKQVLFLNTPELLAEHWPAAASLLEPVVRQAARGEFAVEDLHDLAAAGKAWVAVMLSHGTPALAMVFGFVHYPRKTVLNVIALGGQDLAGAAVSFWPQFLGWAKESGVDEIEACTAPPMTRVLRNLGFSHTYDLVRRSC